MNNTNRLSAIRDGLLQLNELEESYNDYTSKLMEVSTRFGITKIGLVPNMVKHLEEKEKVILIEKLEAIGHEVLFKDVIELWSLRELYKILLNEYIKSKPGDINGIS